MKRIFSLLLSVIFIFLTSFSATAVTTSALGVCLINGLTLDVLYANNEHTRFPMASTTKIMTAYIIAKYADLNTTVTATADAVNVEGTSLGLKQGDTISYGDLIYGMLLPSGNDAANTAAVSFSGSIDEFVKVMNTEAEKLKLENTHFNTPSGLDGDTHYTSAYDLAVICANALKIPFFEKVCSSKKAEINISGKTVVLYNHNKFLSLYNGCIGVKTGFTKKAGRCLVTAVKQDGKFAIAVTLNDKNDWNDHKALMDYAMQNISVRKNIFESENFKVNYAGKNNGYLTATADYYETYLPDDVTLIKQILLPDILFYPINDGELIGEVNYYYKNEKIVSLPVYVAVTEEYTYSDSFLIKIYEYIKYILKCI